MTMINCINQFSFDKLSLSLSLSLHTIPLSFLILGLVKYFFFSQIINFNWVRKFYKNLSTSQPLVQHPVAKRKEKGVALIDLKQENQENGGLYLLRQELEMVMEQFGFLCDQEDVKLVQRFDTKDFHHLFDEREPGLDEVKGAFDVFDKNGDGFIDAGELQRVLSVLGLESVGDCKEMIGVFDENGDGKIDFKEFVKLMEHGLC